MTKPIDLKEIFPHLSKAPIVEAILAINVSPSGQWNETLLNALKERLPDFPKIEPLRSASHKFIVGKPDQHETKDLGCVGFKLQSNDNPHIAQFNKEAFIFSRLEPYSDWEQFRREALRLWEIYCELLKPHDVGRVGLRFVNRIKTKGETVKLEDYYKYPPQSINELNWPLTGYLHHDVMQVPERDYSINLIKTAQSTPGETGLILDIDVFMLGPFVYNKYHLIECLEEMRWVKNKIFFGSLTDSLIKELK